MGSDLQPHPLSPLRKIIAARMSEAHQAIPHFRAAMDIEMDALLALRRAYNADASTTSATPITVNDFIVKASAQALLEVPELNAEFTDGMIQPHRDADIAVVLAVEGGLLTPVVRGANRKSVGRIGAEIRELSERGRRGKLRMEELQGGSFSISNLGGQGIDEFDAIINAPQVAILAVGAAKARPWVRDGQLAVATVMRAVLSMDHRIVDGASGARFLAALKDRLESPAPLLEDAHLS
ncbi:hypothetical protein B9N43_04285 [Denitratisoma sp. DHT3]|uniref:dihydrolipoamide acetyltransferase family protein n=1 Tax=Denitratisoma sp. DHT3 TaxID=1981880 RepID=UPI0011988354|nr:dihydrolipoamide acetyltransferase family protein [Denitratisoma sp. DHT3]QDX80538.1 hypothetical protein B9N43_04285 [Denitratisoma sp. DHT3]